MKKNKTVKKRKKLSKFTAFLFFLISCLFLYLILDLGIVPDKYLLEIVGGVVIANIFILFILSVFKTKIMYVFSLGSCIILAYFTYLLISTHIFLNTMAVDYNTNNYSLITLKSSNYETVSSLVNKKIGYMVDDQKYLNSINIDFIDIKYDDVIALADALLNNKVDAIVLQQPHLDMILEQGSTINNFIGQVRVIKNYSVDIKQQKIIKDINVTKNPFVVYVSGIDTYGKVSSVSRSDVNMIVAVNPNIRQVLLISIPRDYYVELSGKNEKDKLTHAGIYGIETSVKTVEKLLNIDINYYYKVNFTSIMNIVDILDGIDVYSEYSFTSKDGHDYLKGYNHLDGSATLSFVRERKSFKGGDRVRNQNQQAVVKALLQKVTNPKVINKFDRLLNSVKDSFVTNMPTNRLTDLVKFQLETNASWNITTYNLDGANGSDYTYTYKNNKLYVMIPDQETIEQAKYLIQQIYKGIKLNNSNK